MWKPELNVQVKFASKKMGIGTNGMDNSENAEL